MNWAKRQTSNREYNRAAQIAFNPDTTHVDRVRALALVNNWRAIHAFPLNTFQIWLRKKSLLIDSKCIVAQRTKRLASIERKLSTALKGMELTQIQDIGGCRSILKHIKQVNELVDIYKKSDLKHEMWREDNYIQNPKKSGYRGIHLVYKYYSDRNSDYNGLRIEIQIRTRAQHAWSTAVETVDTFTGQSLKNGDGDPSWLRFFVLISSFIAIDEGCPIVPDTPKGRDLLDEIINLDVKHKLSATFSAWRSLARKINTNNENNHLYLLKFYKNRQLDIIGYGKNETEKAHKDYLDSETNQKEIINSVLVSTDSIAKLQNAYPNYFGDTFHFMAIVDRIYNLRYPEE